MTLETSIYELREHAYELIRRCNLALHGAATARHPTYRMKSATFAVADECRAIAAGGKAVEHEASRITDERT